MSKIHLDISTDFDLSLIGISCHEKDYRICWALNKALDLELEKQEEDLEYFEGEEVINSFSFYRFHYEEDHLTYTLVGNRGNNGFLVPEEKKVDFFLMLDDPQEETKNELLREVRNIRLVLTAYPIEPESLRSIENLLL